MKEKIINTMISLTETYLGSCLVAAIAIALMAMAGITIGYTIKIVIDIIPDEWYGTIGMIGAILAIIMLVGYGIYKNNE